MKSKTAESPYSDTSGMLRGDIITFDPSKEGTGGSEEGIIEQVYRFSLVLESGRNIGIGRVRTHRHPNRADRAASPLPPTLTKHYTSFPF